MTRWERLRATLTPKHYNKGQLVFRELQRPWGPRSWRRGFRRRGQYHWVLLMQFGPGAGYVTWSEDRTEVLVHGWKIAIAWRSGSREWNRRFRARTQTGLSWLRWHCPLEVIVTRRAKSVYLSH